MSEVTALPAFQPLVVISVLLAFKMAAVAFVTAKARFDSKVVLNPEDAPVNPGAQARSEEADSTLRVKRAHLNDVENIPVFMFLALLFTLTGCSATGRLDVLRRLLRGAHATHDLLSARRSALANRRVRDRAAHPARHHGAAADACCDAGVVPRVVEVSASTIARAQKNHTIKPTSGNSTTRRVHSSFFSFDSEL